MKRYAIVSTRRGRETPDGIARYLPTNYRVIGTVDSAEEFPFDGPCVVVAGEDRAGWTLDAYVLPRLGSGLIVGKEIDLSHPVMKKIPLADAIQATLPEGVEVVELDDPAKLHNTLKRALGE